MIVKTEVESGIVKNYTASLILTKLTKGVFTSLKLLFCLFITMFVGLCMLPSVKKQIDMDGCIDAGDCKSLQITSEIML